MEPVTVDYCPAKREYPAAFVGCNLWPDHPGLHDNSVEVRADDTTTPGLSRLEVAAYCLIGSAAGVAELRAELESVLGADSAEDAMQAMWRVLLGWRAGGTP